MKYKSSVLLSFIYVNLLPYLCRLPHGVDWMLQYLPDSGTFMFGLLFFHTFYSMPAIILMVAVNIAKPLSATFLLPLTVISIATFMLNHDYDLASDAQAAIGLMVWPLMAAFFGFLAMLLGALLDKFIFKSLPNAIDNELDK